ncbi:MAG TPA: sulfatase-like hydrolase/transferase [Terriglobales bacterium]|nr:sulfatase-like hydrolase/transferase [Terriglobales bacterium]
MRYAVRLVVLLLAGGLFASAQQRPDVFLITIDTLRADHVQCYGYKRVQTPALNRLARDGFRFSQAFTPSPITNSSHVTILTGLLPSHHGVTDFVVPLDASHVTLATLLRQAGYHTAAFIGAAVLDSDTLAPGLDHGFDYYDNFPRRPRTNARFGRLERRGMDVVERAERWLDGHPGGRHFVWIHLYDPHDPYEPPKPYSQIYRDHLYDGEIAYADSALAQFLRYLDKRDWYRPALIVAVGDHGEALGEHGEDTHGIFLYDPTIHVPLIMKLPGSGGMSSTAKSGAVDAQVRTTDILPTILDVLGMRVPRGLDGTSVKAAFAGGGIDSRPAFGESDYPLRFGWAPLRSLRLDNSKLIEAPRPEFYNLKSDPGEVNNMYEPWNKTVQEFRSRMAELRVPTANAGNDAGVSDSTRAELRALGYLGPEGTTNAPAPLLLPDPKDKIQEANLLHKALLASDNGDTGRARGELEKVLTIDPNSVIALRQLGELESGAGENEKAAGHLKRARELSPHDPLIAQLQGQALAELGDLPAAREALESSIHMLPGQFEARRLLAEVDLKLGDTKSAVDQLESALMLQPGNAAVQLALAKAFVADKNFSDAVQQLQQLSKDEPKNAEIYELLARAYEGLGKKEMAQSAAARAAALRRKQ